MPPTSKQRYGGQPNQPDFSSLLTSLNNSGISAKNNALYQTIKGLMEKVGQMQGIVVNDFTSIQEAIDNLVIQINNIDPTSVIYQSSPVMPVFDGEDGPDGFFIPGRDGKNGLDGKVIFMPSDCCHEPEIPLPFNLGLTPLYASEHTFTSSGTTNDNDFRNASLVRCDNATLLTLTGLRAGVPGQRVRFVSVGAGNVSFAHQNGGSLPANRFINVATSAPTTLAAGLGSATYVYDGITARWKLEDHTQGAIIMPAFAAGEYTASGAMTWTVASGDVDTMGYVLKGNVLSVWFHINTGTTLGGVADATLIKTIPGGFTSTRNSQQPCIIGNPGAALNFGKCFVVAGGTALNFRNGAAAALWTLGVGAGMFGVLNLNVN